MDGLDMKNAGPWKTRGPYVRGICPLPSYKFLLSACYETTLLGRMCPKPSTLSSFK